MEAGRVIGGGTSIRKKWAKARLSRPNAANDRQRSGQGDLERMVVFRQRRLLRR